MSKDQIIEHLYTALLLTPCLYFPHLICARCRGTVDRCGKCDQDKRLREAEAVMGIQVDERLPVTG